MRTPDIPYNEHLRLAVVQDLAILDTPAEERFDRITRVAAHLFGVPAASLNLIDSDRQWTKSGFGVPQGCVVPRMFSLCAHTILSNDVVWVPDTQTDPRFVGNPIISGEPVLRFYAACPVRHPNGHAIGTLCLVDVQERYGTETELQLLRDLVAWAERELFTVEVDRALADKHESDSMYHLLANAIYDAVSLHDIDGRYIYVSSSLERLFGYRSDELIGRSGYAYMHPDDHERIAQEYHTRVQHGEPVEAEWRMIHKEGHIIWVSTQAKVVTNADGRPIQMVCTSRDVTQRREMAEALQRSEANLSALIGHIPDAIWSFDTEYHLLTFNTHFADQALWLTGYRPVIGDHFINIIPEEHRLFWKDLSDRALTGERFFLESPLNLFGTNYWFEMSFNPISTDGRTVGVSVIARDVTVRKQDEERRLAFERSLLETQKLESLGVLAGGIAHDFNNLLMAVMGHASLTAMDLPAHSPAQDGLKQIVMAAQRAADLTQQLLAYAGKGRVSVETVNLNELVAEMTALLRTSIDSRGTLQIQLAPVLPIFVADPTQIRQVIMNLVINAAEALPASHGTITLITTVLMLSREQINSYHLGANLSEGPYVVLQVTDTGYGMDASTVQRMFEPFFTTKFTGRGLGLSAVEGIVRSHSGALRVESAPGVGTTITILFPATDSVVTGQPAVTLASLVAQGSVLLIDDDAGVRGVTTRMLMRMGYTVHSARDGFEGVDLFSRYAPDLVCVLLDYTMPHMSGEEVFNALQTIDAEIPVLMMSGYSKEELGAQFAGTNLAGTIQKPFTPQLLREKIQQIVGTHRPRKT